MSIYGDSLLFFPELMDEYEIFSMSPLDKGGWSERVPVQTVSAYITMYRPAVIGHDDGNTESNHSGLMYVQHEEGEKHLRQGLYVEYEGETYRIVADNPYIREGGFTEYRLQIMAGTVGTENTVPVVERRVVDDY